MKMNTNKTNIVLRLFAAMLFLAASQTAFGQEIIRGSNNDDMCDTSIIRAKGNDTVFIYNKKNDHSKSSFIMVANGITPAVPRLDMENLYVNDFELYGNAIYFCGYKIERAGRKAIFGHFGISSFPNATISYYELDTCTELRKLDFYRIHEGIIYPNYENHLVMTGTTTGARTDVVVDMLIYTIIPYPIPPVTPYGCEMYFSNDEDENFDDVAVTSDHVVVSSRRKVEEIPVIDFYQFERPSMLGNTIFSSSFTHLLVWSPAAETPVLLEHVSGDDYAAVYKIEGFVQMVMHQINVLSGIVSSVEILGGEPAIVIPMDIKYNRKTSVFDILAKREYSKNVPDEFLPMQIYHVTPDVVNHVAILGDGTKYPGNFVWSIDPTKETAFFVASGAEYWLPKMFKYRHDQWKDCPESFEYNYEIGKPGYKLEEVDKVKTEWWIPENIKTEHETDEIDFPVICPKQ